ncbi:MAG: 2-phospho-L-lactate guanylyltransferase [Microbacterium sp.]|uniref:2-phospho-L-lactate guanylyltransferase n=1 Tax=Microbacterium sp. TaxID=51671 RepID=UPI0039E49F05
MSWAVVVPVKGNGKSRLAVPGLDRAALARAIALDTIEAVAAAALVTTVVVVTDDAETTATLAGIPKARAVAEPAPRGLNPAIAYGLDAAGDTARAVLLGDLPALRPDDLDAALRLAADVELGAVADAEGTGTTLVTTRRGIPFSPAFGEGSFVRHVAQGCVALGIRDASTLRRDVDTAAQLADAASRGLGPRTAALLAATPGR